MIGVQNPFTTTFSKTPENTYIATEEAQEILDNFSFPRPSESVYKITGVRGSGKTVTLAKIEERLLSEDYQEWIVYRLTPSRDMIQQAAAFLYKEPFVKQQTSGKSVQVGAQILGTGGNIGITTQREEGFFDLGVEMEGMLQAAAENHKKILFGIDEVSRTKDMIVFASEFGKWLRAGYPVYLVCTGLYENMQELSNVKNLTFFRRSTTMQTGPLNFIRMAEIYRSKLPIDSAQAKELAALTKGYAYAFQELGTLVFSRKEPDTLQDIAEKLKEELFAYSYEKIWEELSDGDRALLKLLKDNREYKRSEILQSAKGIEKGYSTYRDRLKKRGLISARQGYISLALPFFGEYMEEYCI